VNKQDNYVVNFNETRRRINVSDASGEVTLTFNPDRASIAIGDFENVTVTAADKFGNKATCYFQVKFPITLSLKKQIYTFCILYKKNPYLLL